MGPVAAAGLHRRCSAHAPHLRQGAPSQRLLPGKGVPPWNERLGSVVVWWGGASAGQGSMMRSRSLIKKPPSCARRACPTPRGQQHTTHPHMRMRLTPQQQSLLLHLHLHPCAGSLVGQQQLVQGHCGPQQAGRAAPGGAGAGCAGAAHPAAGGAVPDAQEPALLVSLAVLGIVLGEEALAFLKAGRCSAKGSCLRTPVSREYAGCELEQGRGAEQH